MRGLAAVCCLVVLGTAPALADPPSQYAFRTFTSEQGLGNTAINAISQTPDGLLWIASQDGLYSYDGRQFHRLGIGDGLPADKVLALLPTASGLWVGTHSGLALVRSGQVVPSGAAGLPPEQVNHLALTPGGAVWAATEAGLFRQRAGLFAEATGLPAGPSYAVWVAGDGTVVAGVGGDLVVSTADDQWRHLGAAAGFGHDRIEAITATPDGVIWVRSALRLWSCDRAVLACNDRTAELPDVSEVGRLFVDHAGRLHVPTRSGLARRVREGAWELLGSDAGLPARSVMTAFEDREGSLWLAADTIYQLLGGGLWRSHSPTYGFPGDTVWSTQRDADGNLWAGTNRGVVHAVDDQWVTFPGTEPYTVQAIADTGTVLYAAGNDGAVMRLDRASGRMAIIGPDPAFHNDGVKSLLYLADELWVATWNAGLLRMRPDGDAYTWRREIVPGGGVHEDFHQLLQDVHGRLWATGSSGLAVREAGTWRRFTAADGLAGTEVNYIVERASGELCVAYSEALGVTCFRHAPGATALTDLRRLSRATGLTSDKIYTLGEDLAGRLYIGQGVGLDLVTDSQVEHFSRATGMVGDDCTARSFFAEANGDILIGTTRGLVRFAASRHHAPTPPVAPIIMSLSLAGVRIAGATAGASPVAGTTSLDVEFATPTFANRTRLVQQIRLLPLESAWREVTADYAHYAQVAPGDYTFEVRARTAANPPGPVTRVAFTIAPAWWQQIWFQGLGLLAVLGALFATIRWRGRVLGTRASARLVARFDANFRDLIEHSPDGNLVHRDGIVLYANARALRYVGLATASELVGKPLRTYLDLPDAEAATERESSLLRTDGTTLLVEVSALHVDFAGTPATLTILRDCTTRKALEARLIAADRMASIGTLAAGIAHEINNPLAYVKANLALITEELDRGGVTPALRGAVADALEGANRVQTIMQGVKTFSRIEDGPREVIEVTRALELALRLTTKQVMQHCQVVRDFEPVPAVVGNESQLGQVFINLLVNAAHSFTTADPTANVIHLVTRTDAGGNAVIEVRDTGCGMSPEVARRVFEPFFTTKQIGDGTGLGLSICHGIVVSLGGTITVTSTPGTGTTFRVVLPGTVRAIKAPAPIPVATRELPRLRSTPGDGVHAEGTPGRLRVLVVDDDVKLLTSIGRMLSKLHDVTLEASSAQALLRLDEGADFDVILSDLMMPGMTGMDLHAQLAVRRPALTARMLFMTGGAFTSQAREFLDQAGIRCLEKPFDMRELRREVVAVAAATPTTSPPPASR